jgi:hypothetical protein
MTRLKYAMRRGIDELKGGFKASEAIGDVSFTEGGTEDFSREVTYWRGTKKASPNLIYNDVWAIYGMHCLKNDHWGQHQ